MLLDITSLQPVSLLVYHEVAAKSVERVLTRSFLAYSGAMDIVLAIIPWRIIWNLTMNKKEKFGVLFAMSMGVLYDHYLSY